VSDESPPAGARTQLRLALRRQPSVDRAHFIVSERNRDAVGAVDSWPDWPGGRLAIFGPEGSGKTHLARAWAARTGAFVAGDAGLDLARAPAGPILVEDVDRGVADDALFHLINRADAGGSLLLTARTAPRLWPARLPDLRSRLNALFAVELGAPDDTVLEALLLRFFRDRHIRPDPDLLSYLLRRMERSATAAQALVSRLDEAADASGRPITRALAREVLGAEDQSGDLFE
jgi:chromosomal replication initiation ATPase DnaA